MFIRFRSRKKNEESVRPFPQIDEIIIITMSAELYGMPMSAPCRIVALTLDYLEVPYDFKFTNLMEGEHMTPEFIKVG